MRVHVYGEGNLAQVVRHCIEPHHQLVEPQDADVVWVCEDVGMKGDGEADLDGFISSVGPLFSSLEPGKPVVISTQLKVGTTAKLEAFHPHLHFYHCPENIRVLHGIEDFKNQQRIVLGGREPRPMLNDLVQPFTKKIVWTNTEEAELVKQGLNGFLALSVAYSNEFAAVCAERGANPSVVLSCVMDDKRVGRGAYLRPGPKCGTHLKREVINLSKLSASPLFSALLRVS